jgi:hypothetical protein
MKKVLFLLLVCTIKIQAQYFFSSNKCYYTYYSNADNEYKLINEYDDLLLFEISEDLTTIEQKTSDAKFNYFVNDIKAFPDNDSGWKIKAVDVNGNNFTFIVDRINDNIRILYTNYDNVDHMLQYEIKSKWYK